MAAKRIYSEVRGTPPTGFDSTQAAVATAPQERLSALVHANARIGQQIAAEPLLEAIASEARTLIRAESAGVGIVGEDGRFERFVHAEEGETRSVRGGIDADGNPALGLLASTDFPLRLDDVLGIVADDSNNGERGIESFLGLPIRIHDRLFGSLYVANAEAGAFDADDEILLGAFASSAALAIEHSELLRESERQRMWLKASADVMQQLFSREGESPFELLLEYAASGANADSATLALRNADGSWSVHSAAGRWEARLAGLAVNSSDTFIGGILSSGEPARTDDYGRDFREIVSAHGIPPRYGPIMGVPLRTRKGEVLGALSVSRTPAGDPFTSADLVHLAEYSGYVGVAMELDRGRDEREARRKVKERERIAADLHDHVIQELFAASVGLSNVASSLGPAERVQVQVFAEAVDSASTRVRNSVFGLKAPSRSAEGLRRNLMVVADEESRALGFAARVSFAGQLDREVTGELAEDVIAVVRESLSNVARHAAATAATVAVGVLGDELVIDVVDDGRGIAGSRGDDDRAGSADEGSGLINIRRRAEAHSGTMRISSAPDQGTHLHWKARISATV